MKIGIIDADLVGRSKHRFPNLVCEKLSGYWKANGAETKLLTEAVDVGDFDRFYVSKVFTDTPVPDWLQAIIDNKEKSVCGGTGFFFDKAPPLPSEIEHHMPDYNLYDGWIEKKVAEEKEKKGEAFNSANFMKQFKSYTDYSIGFLTRGCFRKCKFCVNQKYDRVSEHSPLSEFLDPSRPNICLLDDNFLGCPNWKNLLTELINTNKRFVFKQGLDERLLTDEKAEMLFSAKYILPFYFAFDNVDDYDLIESKLKIIRRHTNSGMISFYVMAGFQSTDAADIENAFKRLALLMKYRCRPYFMKYQAPDCKPYELSEYAGLYTAIGRWCNMPQFFTKLSFREFCEADNKRENARADRTDGLYSSLKAMRYFEERNPEIAARCFDLKFGGVAHS